MQAAIIRDKEFKDGFVEGFVAQNGHHLKDNDMIDRAVMVHDLVTADSAGDIDCIDCYCEISSQEPMLIGDIMPDVCSVYDATFQILPGDILYFELITHAGKSIYLPGKEGISYIEKKLNCHQKIAGGYTKFSPPPGRQVVILVFNGRDGTLTMTVTDSH